MGYHDYLARYEGMSHRDLYNQLTAADAGSVAHAAAQWRTIHADLQALAQQLSSDLNDLMRMWQGPAGAEFDQRITTVSSFASDLSADSINLGTGLDQLHPPVVQAKKEAQSENPDDTNDEDSTLAFAAVGTIVAGPVGGIVGGLFGHSRDEEQREAARQRMIQTVSTLAVSYQVITNQTWPGSVTSVPPALPGSSTGAGPGVAGSGAGGHVTHGPELGVAGPETRGTSDGAFVPSGAADVGDPGAAAAIDDGGPGLSTNTSVLLGAGAAAGLLGAITGALPSGGGARVPGGISSTGLFGNQRGVQGVLGREGLAGERSSAVGGRGAGGKPGAVEEDARAGRGRGGAGAIDENAPGRGGRAAPGEPGYERNLTGANRTGNPDEEDEDERLTWLTEDEMVWGTDGQTPPPVLGPPS